MSTSVNSLHIYRMVYYFGNTPVHFHKSVREDIVSVHRNRASARKLQIHIIYVSRIGYARTGDFLIKAVPAHSSAVHKHLFYRTQRCCVFRRADSAYLVFKNPFVCGKSIFFIIMNQISNYEKYLFSLYRHNIIHSASHSLPRQVKRSQSLPLGKRHGRWKIGVYMRLFAASKQRKQHSKHAHKYRCTPHAQSSFAAGGRMSERH